MGHHLPIRHYSGVRRLAGLAFRDHPRSSSPVRTLGCLTAIAAVLLSGLGSYEGHKTPVTSVAVQQAAEDSLKQQSYHACNKALPDIRFKVAELIERAPGRWQAIRHRPQDQLICTAWQGKVVYIDTAMIQPGNGVIR